MLTKAPPGSGATTRLKGTGDLRRNEAMWFYLLVSPWVIGFLVFTLGPMVASLYLSFTNWDLFTPPSFVGLRNYVRLLTRDRVFHQAVLNTFYYALVSVPLSMALSLGIAYLLNKKLAGMRLFRTLFYLPSLVPVVATALLFSNLFAPTTGLINQGLRLFGLVGPSWLLDAAWVKPALIVMSLWGLGGSVVLLLAGMRGIPQEFYDAAAVDGATGGQQFFRITVPMLSPVIFFNLVLSIIGSLKVFTQVYVLTDGGPNNASAMVVPFLFDNAFEFYRMGYASAVAWLLFIVIIALTTLIFRSSSLWVYYEGEVKSK